MCCHVRSASASRRRPQIRPSATSLVAALDLSKPGERQAHDFLCRATRKRDGMWTLSALRRHGDVLLCVVRWAHPSSPANPFSLAEVSLTEIAVCWRDYPSVEAVLDEMERRCAVPTMCEDAA